MTGNTRAERWNLQCPQTMGETEAEARRLLHSYLGVEHVFNALTRQPEKRLAVLLSDLGLESVRVRDGIRAECGTGKAAPVGVSELTPRLKDVLERAERIAGPKSAISEDHLLRAIFEEGDSLPVRFLASLGHNPETLLARLAQSVGSSDADVTRLDASMGGIDQTLISTPATVPPPFFHDVQGNAPVLGRAFVPPQIKVPLSLPTPTLDQWGRDLSKLARLGRLCEAIGREAEIEQIITILARTQKSNPLLLGEAGVGKTAIVEGLAWQIANGNIPLVLRGKRIVEIEMGSLTSGTTLRGQFEEHVKQVLNEATNAPEVVLFIDEIHTIVGAGKGEGASDAAQMFKPALARGDISCIGATTHDEYGRYLRKDPALERRFSPVTIKELEPDKTLAVLQKVVPRIVAKQASNGQILIVAPEALWAAVTLTDSHVKDRNQPDKSIDAIDIACARAVVKGLSSVSAEDIAFVVSEWTGIPTSRLTSDEKARYAAMESVLNHRVIGQAKAVSAISRSIRAAMAGMKQPNRPVGVFLFMGPSGVGKTKLAKELAAVLFGTSDALIRFDMNEYQEKHTVSNLIGSPRGYVGSEQGGQLTEALRRRPYSVVLLDEIEKGHPDVFNLFLSVFDDGRITDNSGRVVDCSNAVFIMTSNISDMQIGSTPSETADPRVLASKFLKPELVNRITEVVSFAPLHRAELSEILDQLLAEKVERFMTTHHITVSMDESARELILKSDLDPRMGARPLERAVDQMLVQPLVDALFSGNIGTGTLKATDKDGEIIFISDDEVQK